MRRCIASPSRRIKKRPQRSRFVYRLGCSAFRFLLTSLSGEKVPFVEVCDQRIAISKAENLPADETGSCRHIGYIRPNAGNGGSSGVGQPDCSQPELVFISLCAKPINRAPMTAAATIRDFPRLISFTPYPLLIVFIGRRFGGKGCFRRPALQDNSDKRKSPQIYILSILIQFSFNLGAINSFF